MEDLERKKKLKMRIEKLKRNRLSGTTDVLKFEIALDLALIPANFDELERIIEQLENSTILLEEGIKKINTFIDKKKKNPIPPITLSKKSPRRGGRK